MKHAKATAAKHGTGAIASRTVHHQFLRLALIASVAVLSNSLTAADEPRLVLQKGNTSLVMNAVSVTPDGGLVSVAGSDGKIEVWNTESPSIQWTLSGHLGAIYALALDPKHMRLASGGEDRKVRLWDLTKGTQVAEFAGPIQPIRAVALSSDGNWAAAGGVDHDVRLWSVRTGKLMRTFTRNPEEVTQLGFSPDSRWLVSGSSSGGLKVWDVASGDLAYGTDGHQAPVTALAFSADSQLLALAESNKKVELWSMNSRVLTLSFSCLGSPEALAFGPGPMEVSAACVDTSGHNMTVTTHNISAGDEVRSFTTVLGLAPFLFELSGKWPIAFSEDGSKLAFADDFRTIGLWQVLQGHQMKSLGGVTQSVDALAFSPDKRLLALGSGDKSIRIWDSLTGQELRSLTGYTQTVRFLEFSPDGQSLTAVSNDRKATVWDPFSGRKIVEFSGGGSVVVGGNGRWLARKVGTTVTIYDARTGRSSAVLNGVTAKLEVSAIALSPNAKWLASWDRLGDEFRVWNVETQSLFTTVTHAEYMDAGPFLFSPDGTNLIWGRHNGAITLFNILDRATKYLCCHSPRWVNSITVSEDGSRLASAGEDQKLKVWDLGSGRELYTLAGHTGAARALAFTPSANALISGSDDGTATIWDLRNGTAMIDLLALTRGLGWLAAAKSGLFDGSAEGIRYVSWRDSDSAIYPFDRLYNDFFYPGLVSEVLSGVPPPAPSDIGARLRFPALREMAEQNLAHIEERSSKVFLCLARGASLKALNAVEVRGRGQPIELGADFVRDETNAACEWRKELPKQDGPWELFGTTSGWKPPVEQHGATNLTTTQQSTLHVLAVGVTKYDPSTRYTSGLSLDPLPLAASDAVSISDFFSQQKLQPGPYLAIDVVPPLLDDNATLPAIRDALSTLAQKTKPEDVVLLFFAGHGRIPPGQEMFYFMPYVPQRGYYAPSLEERNVGLSTAMLADAVRNLPGRRVVIVIDACQSGGVLDSLAKVAQVKIAVESRLASLDHTGASGQHREIAAGFYLLAAATPIQQAAEPFTSGNKKENGIFTTAVLEVLQGISLKQNHGVITMKEVQLAIVPLARHLADQKGANQTAFPYAVGAADFAISHK